MATPTSAREQAEILLTSLKGIVDQQHAHKIYLESTIEDMAKQIKELQSRNDLLSGRVEQLEKELSTERARKHKRKTSLSRKPSTSSIDENRVPSVTSSDGGVILKSNPVSRSSSFQRKLLEERDGSMKGEYELSSDLKEKQVEAIRNFYGGSEKAERAARTIQYAYREYQMRKNFLKIRQPSTRRRLTIDCIKPSELPTSNDHQVTDDDDAVGCSKTCMSDTEVRYEPKPTKDDIPTITTTPTVIVVNGDEAPRGDDEGEVDAPAATKQDPEETAVFEDHQPAEPAATNSDEFCVVETSFAKVVNTTEVEPQQQQEEEKVCSDQQDKDAADALQTLENALLEGDNINSKPTTVADDQPPPFSPPSEEEMVRRILADDPVMPFMDPNSSLFKNRKQRKRHGYETVAEISHPPAPSAAVTTPATSTTTTNSTNPVVPQVSVSSVQTPPTLHHNRQLPPFRTNSQNSLHSGTAEVEGDRESIKSYDSSSITSEMSASTSVSAGETASNYNTSTSSSSGYHRRSTISRESWHVNENNDTLRKRLYRIGLNLFNRKPAKGLDFLIDKQFVLRTPPAIANFLLNRKGLSRQMVGEYLGSPQHFCREVLDSVCELMDFNDMDIDQALRSFQAQIRVQGEAQKVERLIEAFSQRYCTCNTRRLQAYKNPDAIFIVAYAIIMLNTDLHSPNMKNERRMTEQGFIKNLRGIDNGDDLSEEMLLNVYQRIKESELTTMDDHVTQVLQVENNIVGKKPTLAVPHRRLVCFCRLFQVHDQNKPQKPGLHQREVFLFNDMILITKMLQKKKMGTTYTFKNSLSLNGLSFLLFETSHFPNGVRLVNKLDNKSLMAFNAPNETDRSKFVNDLRESIAEVEQMEHLRIGAELEKAHTSGMSPSESRRNSLQLVDTKKISASMSNLNANGTTNSVNIKLLDARIPDLRANIRPTSMYVMGGHNNTNNNNNNNNTPTTNASTTRLPNVIGNLLTSNKRQQQQEEQHRLLRRFNKARYNPTIQQSQSQV